MLAMIRDKQSSARKQLQAVTWLSIGANLFLVTGKFTVGAITGSLSITADAIHSVSDMLTDFAVLIGLHLGSKKPDSTHQYGHGKLETLSAAAIAIGLLGVGLGTVYYAAHDIAKGNIKHPGYLVLITAVLAIAIKEVVFRITRSVATKHHCPAALANAWHDRADALSSVAVVIGVVVHKFGLHYGDQIAAVAVGVMITFVGAKLISECLAELTEQAVDQTTMNQINDIVRSESQVRQYHRLRTRAAGREIFLDLHILVDPELSISAAHAVAERLETSLHNQIARPVNIVIHIEPDLPELRK